MKDGDPMKGRIYKSPKGETYVVMTDAALNDDEKLVVIMQRADSTSHIGVCCSLIRLRAEYQRLA